MSLVHCVYCSVATRQFDRSALQALLQKARQNNARRQITGILLYHHGCFLQVIEGEKDAVDALFAKIAADPRHTEVTKLIEETVEHRDFANWSMGFPAISYADLSKIPGLNDFFTEGRSYMEIGQGRAKTLLCAFKEGLWHFS